MSNRFSIDLCRHPSIGTSLSRAVTAGIEGEFQSSRSTVFREIFFEQYERIAADIPPSWAALASPSPARTSVPTGDSTQRSRPCEPN